MSLRKASEAPPPGLLLLSDVLGLLLSTLPTGLTLLVLFEVGKTLWSTAEIFWLFLLTIPWTASLILITVVTVIRLLLPRLKPGRFKVGANRGFFAWYTNFLLNRALLLSGLKNFIFASAVLRYLYLRGMGAKVPFRMNTSMGIDFIDLPLITIGENVTLAEKTYISCHSFTGSLLFVSPVVIGPSVFIGLDVTIGPGTEIGANSWIGSMNAFLGDKIPADSYFTIGVWDRGNPARVEKAQARMGASPPKGPQE